MVQSPPESLKSEEGLRTEGLKIYYGRRPITQVLKRKQKELTMTFMMIFNRKNLWFSWFIPKYFSDVRGKIAVNVMVQ